ncbi:MAG: FIST signal transduction protein [Flavobacteriales bacterium]
MLQFYSSSARVVNTRRAVTECMEIALGEDYHDVDLIILHASIGHQFKEMVDQAHVMAPNARIVATSCCGVVGREGVSESMKDMALMAIKGKEFGVASVNEIYGKNSYEKSLEMAKSLKEQAPATNMVYFLASGIDIDNDECIRAFEEVFGEDVTLFGATSSDNMRGVISFQAVDQEVYEHAAYAVGFADPTLKVDTQATHGFVAIGDPMIVTKSSGHIIHELNGKPAWEEFTHRLGLTPEAACGDTIPIGALGEELSPELAKEYGNKHLLRAVTKREGNDMHYATTIHEGTKLWLTTRDEDLIFSEMDRMVVDMKDRMQGKTPVAVFHADCLARGRFLFNRIIKDELVSKMQYPFYSNGECPPWLGMYGFGEFARLSGKNTFHNYTTALYVIYR